MHKILNVILLLLSTVTWLLIKCKKKQKVKKKRRTKAASVSAVKKVDVKEKETAEKAAETSSKAPDKKELETSATPRTDSKPKASKVVATAKESAATPKSQKRERESLKYAENTPEAKLKRIAKGEKKNTTDYPTFDDILSDWDEEKNKPVPKKGKLGTKEKIIAAGATRNKDDYPTMGDILSDWGSKDEAAKKEEEKEEDSSGEDFFVDSKKHKNKKPESESLKFENNADTGGEDKEKYGKEVAVPWKRRKCYTRRKRSDDLEMRKQRKALNESGKNTPLRESAEGKAGQIPMMATQGTDSADKMATQDDQSGLDHTGASSEKTGVDYSHSGNDLQKWEETQHSNEKVDIGMQETPKSPEESQQKKLDEKASNERLADQNKEEAKEMEQKPQQKPSYEIAANLYKVEAREEAKDIQPGKTVQKPSYEFPSGQYKEEAKYIDQKKVQDIPPYGRPAEQFKAEAKEPAIMVKEFKKEDKSKNVFSTEIPPSVKKDFAIVEKRAKKKEDRQSAEKPKIQEKDVGKKEEQGEVLGGSRERKDTAKWKGSRERKPSKEVVGSKEKREQTVKKAENLVKTLKKDQQRPSTAKDGVQAEKNSSATSISKTKSKSRSSGIKTPESSSKHSKLWIFSLFGAAKDTPENTTAKKDGKGERSKAVKSDSKLKSEVLSAQKKSTSTSATAKTEVKGTKKATPKMKKKSGAKKNVRQESAEKKTSKKK